MNYKQGKTDRPDELIMSHLGYVDGLAKQRIKYYFPVELDDLIQAGRLGLIEAARRFNPKKSKQNKIFHLCIQLDKQIHGTRIFKSKISVTYSRKETKETQCR